jgi:hypothetical protein
MVFAPAMPRHFAAEDGGGKLLQRWCNLGKITANLKVTLNTLKEIYLWPTYVSI